MTEIEKSENEFAKHWLLVLVCALGIGIGVSSLPFYTQGVFFDSWIKEFGWSRTQASLGVLATTLTLAFISPFVGAAVDKYGLVKPISAALFGLVITFSLFALFMSSIASFVILSALMAVLAGASSPLAYTRAVNAVFDKQRGLALGLALSGTGLAAILAPRIISGVIDAYGWRMAYWVLAGFVAIAGVLIIAVLSRLDGAKTPKIIDQSAAITAYGTAKVSREFKLLSAAVFCLALGIGGLLVHFVPILTEAGITKSRAAEIAGIMGGAIILGRIVIGAVVDRVFAPFVAATFITACICGIVALAIFGPIAALPAAFVIGFSMGAEVDLIGYLVARYFPLEGYGRIYGRQYAAFLVGTGLGPVAIGLVRDKTGNYTISIILAACVLALTVLLFLRMPKFSQGDES